MAKNKNILEEAIADAKALREGAVKNAQNVLMEHLKSNIKEFVDSSLSEEEDCVEETLDEESEMAENANVQEMEDLDLADDDMEEEDDELSLDTLDDEEDDDLEEGITEADLDEVLEAALQEVDHGDLGEMEEVDFEKRADSRGLMDDDAKARGWEEKEPPAKKDWQVKEAAYKAKIAQLAKESLLQRKALAKLQEAVAETQLFNHKVLFTSKLLQSEGLNKTVKKQIIRSMDEGKSLAEVKNTFNTWKTALGVMSESAKPSRGTRGSLSEALGSNVKSEGKGISRVDDSHLLNESVDPFSVERLKKLAGL